MTAKTLRSPRRTAAILAAQPSVFLNLQCPKTHVYVETTDHYYELTLLDRCTLKIEIVSDDPRLGVRTVGFFERSTYDENGKVSAPGRIVEGMRMRIRFANGVFCSRPAATATVVGDGWHYKVF